MEHILQRKFGFSSFRSKQKEVIESIIAGRDTLALFPTGMGKSLCYEMIPYVVERPVLIISPLISLMEDQVRRIKERGEKRVIALTSTLTLEERQYVISRLHQYRYIFVSPEMLQHQTFGEPLLRIQYGAIAVDEAHCVSQWGFDFRPDYLQIASWVEQLPERPPIVALTATATEHIVEDIMTYLQLVHVQVFRERMNRENLLYNVQSVDPREKDEYLDEFVTTYAAPGIVYTKTRKRADELATRFATLGVDTAAYHGGISRDDRTLLQQQFLHDELEWIVATSAFGMGVDKPNIRHVVHEHIPLSLHDYVQEIGRAGRDGKWAFCTLLHSEADVQQAQQFLQYTTITPAQFEQYTEAKADKMTDEQMMNVLQLDSTLLKILKFYDDSIPSSEIVQFIQSVTDNKREQLRDLIRWLHQSTCYRTSLLSYFRENSVANQTPCCSNCHSLPLQKREHRVKEIRETSDGRDWQLRLRQLFDVE